MKSFLRALYRPYKWIVVIPFMMISTFFHGSTCILSGLIFGPGRGNIFAVSWARSACLIAPIRVHIRGKAHYLKGGSYVVVANHQSMVDIPVLHGWLGLKIKWVMKKELKNVPVFGEACRNLGCIFVDRANNRASVESMDRARAALGRHASVLFFPEGTRSRDGGLLPFKKGAFRFAMATGLPILPVTVKNTRAIMPADSLELFPGIAEVIIHPPVEMAGVGLDDLDQLMEDVRVCIARPL